MTKRMGSSVGAVFALVVFIGLATLAHGQEVAMSAIKYNSGQTVQPAYEGWTKNADGSFAMWFGYMNRNYKETPDIPAGPNNGFGVGGEDLGQPTHFLPRRQDTIFKVNVPALKAYGSLWPVWEIEPQDSGVRQARLFGDPENKAPKITTALPDQTATAGEPLTLKLSVSDDGLPKPPPARRGGGAGRARANADVNPLPDTPNPNAQGLRVKWVQWRGGGTVKFSPETAPVVDANEKPIDTDGTATTKVTFEKPGTYTLRAYALDRSLFMGIQDVKVTVTGSPQAQK